MVNNNPLKHILSLELNTGKKVFLLEKNIHSVGRSSSNSIIINHRVTSRHHGSIIKVIYQKKDRDKFDIAFWIVDGDFKGNKSRNGLFVNTQKINIHKLSPGDIIIFGGVEIRGKYDIFNSESQVFFSNSSQDNIENLPSLTETETNIFNEDIIPENFNQSDYQELKHIDTENKYFTDTIAELIEGIIFIEPENTKIIDCNQSLVEIVGYANKEDILALNIKNIFPIDIEILKNDISLLLDNQYQSIFRESILKQKDNKFLPIQIKTRIIQHGEKNIICLSILKIEEQKKLEELLRYRTYHNLITNLPNYKLFREHLFSVLASYSNHEEGYISLILVRINEWKEIGYNYNYEVAEFVLKKIAKKFKQLISAQDILYHWRDDEFVFLLAQNSTQYVDKIKYDILQIAQQPLLITEEEIQVSFSIGSASYPEDGDYEEILLQKADRTLTENYYEYVKERC
ncbi:diguanylate cyclase [Cyanobacterium stanieri LEGE 03274]|uniref:Diguanylate cyclase n=1 Tax=Cyanobacterium stanieri LEGE 03274 TaxID=1828756 RepID=A0ABR9V3C1_9CHRO|nr:diguanylate cyclase [Cyanobacterium stanieri]MBE9222046.1 diguanylate cyclase [Cyanobacterium stanieri LEGE 03274]